MRWLLVCLALLDCRAQQPLSLELSLLTQIKLKMAENLKRLPNYTCQTSIERTRRPAPAKKFQFLDTVRLEVAMVGNKELYGWPGANKIAEAELRNLVGGTIGNGDFGLLARSIFLSDGAQFTYKGETMLGAAKAVQFDYRVPLLSSGYYITVEPNQALVGYHGTIWADAASFDLIRLDLFADDIPLSLGLSACNKTLRYQRASIANSEFLLPLDAELLMVDLNGTENRNRTRFNGCRQYLGESVLKFDDAPADAPKTAEPVAAIDLPDDFTADLALVTPIDSRTTAVGDPVDATLLHGIKHGHALVAPKGAILHGRIAQLQNQGRSYAFALSFYSLDSPAGHASLDGRSNDVSIPDGVRQAACVRTRLSYAACDSQQHTLGPLSMPGEHFQLLKGFPLFLRSRLVKFDKQ